MERILNLPPNQINQDDIYDIYDVFLEMSAYKKEIPDPDSQFHSDLRKTEIIFELTIRRVELKSSTWEGRSLGLTEEYNFIKEKISRGING